MVSRKAKEEDLPKIMELINKAYEVETGNTGLAFKCQKRYLDLGEVQPFLDNFYVLRLEPKSEIIGVVKARFIDDSSILDIGPLAVDPVVQVNIFFLKYNQKGSFHLRKIKTNFHCRTKPTKFL